MSDKPVITKHESVQTLQDDQHRWDERYRAGKQPGQGEINDWVRAQQAYLQGSRALDVACGMGRHTLWLAELGYTVDAVDISMVGLSQLQETVNQQGLTGQVNLIHADLKIWRPQPQHYDLVLVVRYLDRDLWPALVAALAPGGLLLYRTFHIDALQLRPDFNPQTLLQPGELLAAFKDLQLLAYEERRLRPGGTSHDDCTSSILVRKPGLNS